VTRKRSGRIKSNSIVVYLEDDALRLLVQRTRDRGGPGVCSAVIVLSLYDDPQTRAYAIAAGASAVVSKHDADERLLMAIRSAAP
jgi:DNA-binding NarL/FixJ family response regulator